DFKGKTYLFYHDGALPGGGGFTRSVSVTQINFQKNGSITSIKMNPSGITKGIGVINPYLKNEGETIAWSKGIKSSFNNQVGVFVKAERKDSFTKIKDVDFNKNGATK